MPALGSEMAKGGREKQDPLSGQCPICVGHLTNKGDCMNSDCQVYSVKGSSRGRGRGWTPERIVWCSSPRLKPLSNEELRSLLEPYLTPSVEKLIDQM